MLIFLLFELNGVYNTFMDIGFLLIMAGFIYGVILLIKFNSSTSLKCDEKGELHVWVVKGLKPNSYLVCSKCRVLPGGDQEEGPRTPPGA